MMEMQTSWAGLTLGSSKGSTWTPAPTSNNNGMDYITARLGSEGSPMLAFGGDYNPEQWPEAGGTRTSA